MNGFLKVFLFSILIEQLYVKWWMDLVNLHHYFFDIENCIYFWCSIIRYLVSFYNPFLFTNWPHKCEIPGIVLTDTFLLRSGVNLTKWVLARFLLAFTILLLEPKNMIRRINLLINIIFYYLFIIFILFTSLFLSL